MWRVGSFSLLTVTTTVVHQPYEPWDAGRIPHQTLSGRETSGVFRDQTIAVILAAILAE